LTSIEGQRHWRCIQVCGTEFQNTFGGIEKQEGLLSVPDHHPTAKKEALHWHRRHDHQRPAPAAPPRCRTTGIECASIVMASGFARSPHGPSWAA